MPEQELVNGLREVTTEIVSITPSNIDEVSKLHRQAFADSLNVRLGASYTRALIRWFATSPQRIALAVSYDEHRVVGYVLGAPLSELPQMNRVLLPFVAMGLLLRPWLLIDHEFRHVCLARLSSMLQRSAEVESTHDLPEPVMSLVGIGVASTARRKGVGVSLMQAFENRARELRMCSLELTVRRSNNVAIDLYRGCGWQETAFPGEIATTLRFAKVLQG